MTQKSDPPAMSADVLECLSQGGAAWGAQDYAAAKRHAIQALERAQSHRSVHGELGALHLLANIAFNQCEDEASRKLHEQVKTRSLEIGFWEGAASSLTNLALFDIFEDHIAEACDKYQQAIDLYQAAGNDEMVAVVRSILSQEKLETVLAGIPRIPTSSNVPST